MGKNGKLGKSEKKEKPSKRICIDGKWKIGKTENWKNGKSEKRNGKKRRKTKMEEWKMNEEKFHRLLLKDEYDGKSCSLSCAEKISLFISLPIFSRGLQYGTATDF